MKNNVTTMQSNGAYINAKRRGFSYSNAKERYFKILASIQDIIQRMGGKPQPFKIIMAYIFITIAVILGFVEASNVQNSIVASTGLSSGIAYAVGFAFCLVGLVAGEQISSGIRKDSFTGHYKLTAKFWLGLFLTALYVYGQYYLASSAGSTVPDEYRDLVQTTSYFVLGIAVIEVLIGLLFLRPALETLSLVIANLRLRYIKNRMHKHSRLCEENWQRYAHARMIDANVIENEQTDAIRQARAYYNSGGEILYMNRSIQEPQKLLNP